MKTKIFNQLLFLLVTTQLFAQKLPTVQVSALNLPANLKVDGKATEWGDKYQAYNNATDVFYTIANDSSTLYLIVRAERPRIIQKIIYSGLTLTVNAPQKDKNGVVKNASITYPILTPKDGGMILTNARLNTRERSVSMGVFNAKIDSLDARKSLKQIDSTVAIANQYIPIKANTIKVKGFDEITDTLISIYNEQRVKVAAAFDSNGALTYELSIPLKYLKAAINGQSFLYTVRLNSRFDHPQKGMIVHYSYPVKGAGPVSNDLDLDTATDFKGNYQLILK